MSEGFYARPIVAASVALLRDGRVLIARRARAPMLGLYSFPGGRVELGETLAEAAARELKEETGLVADCLEFLAHVDAITFEGDRVSAHFVIAAFTGRWIGGEPAPGPELDAFAWVRGDEIGGFRTTEELPRLVEKALRVDAARG